MLEKAYVLIDRINQKGYKDIDLAAMLGVTKSYVSILKNGKRDFPSVGVYKKLLEIAAGTVNDGGILANRLKERRATHGKT